MEKSNRRDLIKKSGLSLASFGLLAARPASALEVCGLTPAQTEGPFYPIEDQLDKDSDLTWVKSKSSRALGERVILKGRVLDQNCKPVVGALVEIWQACHTGKYNHPGDPNPAGLDPNFQYWGRVRTNVDGSYEFLTIIPGTYQATRDWVRPPHIHFKVHLRGHEELTSQIYFKGHPLNSNDRVLQGLSKLEQEKLLVDFTTVKTNGVKVGSFDITLRSLT